MHKLRSTSGHSCASQAYSDWEFARLGASASSYAGKALFHALCTFDRVKRNLCYPAQSYGTGCTSVRQILWSATLLAVLRFVTIVRHCCGACSCATVCSKRFSNAPREHESLFIIFSGSIEDPACCVLIRRKRYSRVKIAPKCLLCP